jgi:UDP-N-acetylmuramate--alanine ligase
MVRRNGGFVRNIYIFSSIMKIHFIGIGGIGVSALARYYKSIGAEVVGSDLVASEITSELELEGINIFVGPHSAEHIKQDIDLVVFSAAIGEENLELKKAKELDIKTAKYSDALSEIAKDYFTICIAGTHGKSTKTSM